MTNHRFPTQAKIPYLYITGTGYSGSTLLAFLLNAHPDMMSISEVGGPLPNGEIQKFRCSCGALFLQCPFFLKLERQINTLGSSFQLTDWQTEFQLSKHRLLNIFLVRPLRSVVLEQIRDWVVPFWPGYRQAISVIGQRNVHLARAALAISGKKAFVDAEKDSIRVKFLQDIEQLELKVIHLVRDVRAGVDSIMKRGITSDAGRATRMWVTANMNSERARRYVSSDQWFRMKYSDLCTDPQGSVDQLSDFIGVQRAPIPKDFYAVEHHIIGNRMRLQGTGVVREDMSWKDRLTERDLSIIARIGGVANRYFGYNFP